MGTFGHVVTGNYNLIKWLVINLVSFFSLFLDSGSVSLVNFEMEGHETCSGGVYPITGKCHFLHLCIPIILHYQLFLQFFLTELVIMKGCSSQS